MKKYITHRDGLGILPLIGAALLLPQFAKAQDIEVVDPVVEPAIEAVADEPAAELTETIVTSPTPPPPAPTPAPRPAPTPAPTPAPAPPAPEPPAPEPEPFVEAPIFVDDPLIPTDVTAFKTGTPLIDIPSSVTIFTDQRLQDQSITAVSELIDYTPGATNSQGEGHRDAVVFRGRRTTADFYIDGLRDDVQHYRSLYNIERVEVLRGASALYFGRGGTGGILNRVLKKPILSEYSAKGYTDNDFREITASVDSFGAAGFEFDINQGINDNSGFRLNTFYEYLNNHRDFYDGDRYGINPTYAVMLTPDTRLDLSYEYNNYERFIDRGIPSGSNGLPVSALADVVFGDSARNVANFEAHVARATLTHEINENWQGRLMAMYGDYSKRYENFYARGYDQSTDQVTMDGYVDTTERTSTLFAGDLVGNFETGCIEHQVLIGAEHIHTSNDNDRLHDNGAAGWSNGRVFNASNFSMSNYTGNGIAGPTTVSYVVNDDTHATVDAHSFYFQDEIAISDYIDVILGGRYDSFDLSVRNLVNGTTQSRKDEQFSPRLGVVFKPIEDISIYGSYSETFLPQSGGQFASRGADLEPNTFSNLEFGVNINLRDDLALRLAAFEGELDQIISQAGVARRINSEVNGFEGELSGYLNDRWYMSAGYTYLTGEEIGNDGQPTGNRLQELPRHQSSVWNKYDLTDCFGLGLGVVFQDHSIVDTGDPIMLPSYTRVDAAAYYRLNDSTRIQLNIENLFDTEYFPTSHSDHQITVGRPINAALSIKKSF